MEVWYGVWKIHAFETMVPIAGGTPPEDSFFGTRTRSNPPKSPLPRFLAVRGFSSHVDQTEKVGAPGNDDCILVMFL